MFSFLVRRVLAGVVLLLVMSLVTFLIFFSGFLNPARFACGKSCSIQQQQQTKKALGYDKPVIVQWANFTKGIVVGRDYPDDPTLRKTNPELVAHCGAPCFGYSVYNTETVDKEMVDAAPISASVAVAAFIIWIAGGILFGVLAALRRGKLADRGIVGLSLVFYSFPSFFVGLLLLKFVAIKYQIVPVPDYTPIAQGGLLTWAYNLLLPAVTLALLYMAGYIRMSRAFVLEALGEDYIRTAKAKGLVPRRVIFKHGLRAALTPLVTMAGLDLASVLGGAIITETVFNFNGLGKLAVDANNELDLPTLVGLVILLGGFVIVANIVVDVLYAVIDPRVRLG